MFFLWLFFDGSKCDQLIDWSPFFKSIVYVNPGMSCSLFIWTFFTFLSFPLVGAWMIFPMHRGMPEIKPLKSFFMSIFSMISFITVIYAFFNYVPPEGHIYYRAYFVLSVFSSKSHLIFFGWIFSLTFSAVFWLVFLAFLSPYLKSRHG